eukprot:CAMPEP_0204359352 /NCGR_PEP_ID=MMETSP0469-20131031/37199_1 /ASSEMBLY_ACC=CAM_ASM_000384 /TAXON_ID=2969 /ORGANISM="Oxyrrhis marina" /LENGTH=63 /DNA_ID=CAMNT_0051347367 /DNA_START=21 /DNA_END=208 /DNA_ORIENTATION=+
MEVMAGAGSQQCRGWPPSLRWGVPACGGSPGSAHQSPIRCLGSGVLPESLRGRALGQTQRPVT